MRAHLRGRTLPSEEPIDLWVHDGVISIEPIADADTVFDGGWLLPGLVDAHCHVGIGPQGPTSLEEAVAQAEAEREVGALLLRDAGSPVDTRGFDEREDLPRIIRAGRHLAKPKRYIPGLPLDIEDDTQLPEAVALQARWGDGWVKLVGDWIDRAVGDLAPLWSDEILKQAIAAAHANGARVTACHRACLRRGRAAWPHSRRHRLHRARHRSHRRHHRPDGRTWHRARSDGHQYRELPRYCGQGR